MMRMGKSSETRKRVMFLCVSVLFVLGLTVWAAEEVASPVKDQGVKDIADRKEAAQKNRGTDELIANLPADSTPVFQISEITITGNDLLTSCTLLGKLPAVYDASTGGAENLYDLRGLQQVAAEGGGAVAVSARSMKGLTLYILSRYKSRGYSGIYVYVPSDSYGDGNALSKGVLPITVLEAKVSDVGVRSFDVAGEPVEKGRLSHKALLGWSPVKEGQVANQKKMDDMVNLLNRNPDRYMTAVVSKGSEPESLAVNYDVYEGDPWHFFAQVDNAGTRDRQWTPRFGIINTNTLGFDDILTLMYQTPFDKRIGDQFSAFGSYDFPLLGPRLRLNLYGGYNEFDITGTGSVDFLGRGYFYGGTLRLNVLQANKWFFDVTGSLSHLESRITPSLFPDALGSSVGIDKWGMGVEIYRELDMSDTRFAFQRWDSYDGSDDAEFGLARTGAKSDFSIYTAAVRHSMFLDADKIQNLSGSFRYISADERLHPSQMTAFGGMYSVRGYDEYEVIGDGGILTSLQYEYDLIKRHQAKLRGSDTPLDDRELRPFVRKLAPLVFFDYGQARIEDASGAENRDQELCSWGFGAKVELGDNFTGVVYYGYPLIETAQTREGKGRVNVGFLWRF